MQRQFEGWGKRNARREGEKECEDARRGGEKGDAEEGKIQGTSVVGGAGNVAMRVGVDIFYIHVPFVEMRDNLFFYCRHVKQT